jgi:hypothetical protein
MKHPLRQAPRHDLLFEELSTSLVEAVRIGGRWIAAGAAALVVAGVSSGAALALPPYSVHITVQSTITKSSQFEIVVAGNSANLSRLIVFTDRRLCALTAGRESSHPKAVKIIAQNVVGAYSKVRTLQAKVVGQHEVCAYLRATPPSSLQRARATAAYNVVP